MHLEGKIVLITGASDGIGAACAAVCERRGSQVAMTGRSAEKLERAALGRFAVAGDLTHAGFRSRVISEVVERFGRIDVLINNAGAGLYAPAHRAPISGARELFELNFFAPLELIQLALPHMKPGSAIVNVSSIAGKMVLPWFTMYSASKFALSACSSGLRIELRRAGIHVMDVCPGYVKTGFQQHVLHGRPPDLNVWQQRWAITPEQCAEDIARGVERDARTVVTPRSGWLLIAAQRLFPSIVDRRLEKIYLTQEARG